MPSSCPKCHRLLEHDEICCAQVCYTWKCKECHKLSTGFAVPYGKCFLCGGDLAIVEGRDLGDPMRMRAIRDAVQFELNAFYFYKLARDRAANPEHRLVLERLYEAELDHLHGLSEKYHAHIAEMPADHEEQLAGWLFHDLAVPDDASVRRLYQSALEMECRTRDHFRRLAADLPAGLEKDLCLELASEEEEHIAMLETELEQLT